MPNDSATAMGAVAIPERTLPEIQESASLKDAFHQLDAAQTRGFYLISQGQRTVVNAEKLADAILDAQPDDDLRNGNTTLDTLMARGALQETMVSINHTQELKTRLHTPPLIFFCSNPNPSHPNSEWGDGYCRQCPWPLQGKE